MVDKFISSFTSLSGAVKAGLTDVGSLHPSVVHIPIGLLFAVPVFLLLGIVLRKTSKQYFIGALTLLIIGTLGLYLATYTGEHAASSVQLNDANHATLEKHYHLAEDARLYFSILTGLVLAYVIFLSMRKEKLTPQQHLIVQILLLGFCLINLVILLNAAHYGGKLVHYHGISSPLYEVESPNQSK